MTSRSQWTRRNMKCFKLCLFVLIVLPCCAMAITIETVPVGNVKNPNDPATGSLYGGVAYPYRMGKFEVTIGQYTAFLNAVAKTDTYHLYGPSMASDLMLAGISRSGSPGKHKYTPIGSPQKPISYVTWGDAARFANWLHNGQPSGEQNPCTTEDGAYTLNGAVTSAELMAIRRNPCAQWFIPTENEWYKAAYHQPANAGGDSDDYWAYPMKSNSRPFSDQPPGMTPDNTRVGNFYFDDFIANGYDDGIAVTGSEFVDPNQNYLTEVGAYKFSPSPYGTFDQGGLLWEYTETKLGDRRVIRGGAIDSWAGDDLLASTRTSSVPASKWAGNGFRVASVPRPRPLGCQPGVRRYWQPKQAPSGFEPPSAPLQFKRPQ